MSGIDVDIGKMLASMDKPSLLSMLTSLLSQSKDASLPAQILSLLPTPSLDSVETSLDELEKAIRAAIPFVADGSSARHEYTWSRLRAPHRRLVDAALGYLPFFVTELDSGPRAAPSRARSSSAGRPRRGASSHYIQLLAHHHNPGAAHRGAPSFSDQVQPGVQPLHRVKSAHVVRIRRSQLHAFITHQGRSAFGHSASDAYGKHSNLAYLLGTEYASPSSPDTLMSVLMPAILKQWTTLLHRLDKAVNGDGRMFSQEVVLTWARNLEATGTAAASATATAPAFSSAFPNTGRSREEGRGTAEARGDAHPQGMDEVRNRLERDLAWLVGGAQHYASSANALIGQRRPGKISARAAPA